MELRAPKSSINLQGEIKFLKNKIVISSDDGDVYELGYENVAEYCDVPTKGTFKDVNINLSKTGTELRGVKPTDGNIMVVFDSLYSKDGVPTVVSKPGFKNDKFTIPPGDYFRVILRVAIPNMEWMTLFYDFPYKFSKGAEGGSVFNVGSKLAARFEVLVNSCGVDLENLYIPYSDSLLVDLEKALTKNEPEKFVATVNRGFVKDLVPRPLGM